MTQRGATLGVLMDAKMAEAVTANLFLMEHTNATVYVKSQKDEEICHWFNYVYVVVFAFVWSWIYVVCMNNTLTS